MSADSGPRPQPTAHDRDDDQLPETPMARRSFMRRSAIGALAAIGAANGSSGTVAADEDDDDESFDRWDAAFYGTAAINPVGTLLGYGIHTWRNSSTAHGEELWQQIHADALEQERLTNAVLGSIENDATTLEGYLQLEVASAIVETAPDEDQQATEEAALAVLEDEVSEILRNLFNVWTVNWLGFLRRVSWAYEEDTGEFELGNIFNARYVSEQMTAGGDQGLDVDDMVIPANASLLTDILDDYIDADENMDDPDEQDPSDYERIENEETDSSVLVGVDLPNDEEVYVPMLCVFGEASRQTALLPFEPTRIDYSAAESLLTWDPDYYDGLLSDLFAGDEDAWAEVDDEEDSIYTHYRTYGEAGEDTAIHLESVEYLDAFNQVMDTYESFSAEIMELADNLYEPAAAGEVTADEIANGTALLDAAQDGDDWQAAAGYYRAGRLSEADDYGVIRTPSVEFQGTLFATDRSGIEIPTGEWVDPDDVDGSIHIAAEVTDTGDFTDDAEDGDEEDDLDDVETSLEVGDIITSRVDGAIKVVEPDDGTLGFEESSLYSPDDDPMDIFEDLTDAYESEQETRDGDTEVNVDVGLPGIPSNPLDSDGAGLLGLGLIGVVILAVIGFVTDLIPGLGD